MLKHYYRSKSLNNVLSSFENFKDYVNPSTRNWQPSPLKNFFNFYDVEFDYNFDETKDCFGYEFDHIIKYKKYIGEQYDTIVDIIYKNNDTLLASDTGTGKSTTVIKLFKATDGIKLYVCPNNVLDGQIAEIMEKNGINVYRYYDGKHEEPMGNSVLVCNLYALAEIKSLNIDFTLTVFDEVHRKVDYSTFYGEEYYIPMKGRKIYISATPESYVVGMKDFAYIRCLNENQKKRDIIMNPVSNKYGMMNKLIEKIKTIDLENERVCVYMNNKDYNKKVKKYFKKLNFKLIDSDNKDETYERLVEQERLDCNVVVTSLINDGINIKDEKFDHVLILENFTQAPWNIYQFANRFRKAEPEINIYYVPVYGLDKKTGEPYEDYEATDERIKIMLNDEFEQLFKNAEIKSEKINMANGTNNEGIMDDVLIYDDNGVWKPNTDRIRLEVYKNWFKSVRYNIVTFKNFLRYYFNIVKTFKKDESESKGGIKAKRTDCVDFVLNNIELIEDIFKSGDYGTDKIKEKFIKQNKYQISMLKNRIHEIEELKQHAEQYNIVFDVDVKKLLNKTNTTFRVEFKKHKVRLLKKKNDGGNKFDNAFLDEIKEFDKMFNSLKDKFDRADFDDVVEGYKKHSGLFAENNISESERFVLIGIKNINDIEEYDDNKRKRVWNKWLKGLGYNISPQRTKVWNDKDQKFKYIKSTKSFVKKTKQT